MLQRSKSRDASSRGLRTGNSRFYVTDPKKLSKSPTPNFKGGFPGLNNRDSMKQYKQSYMSPKIKDVKNFIRDNKSPPPSKVNDENKKPSKSETKSINITSTGGDISFSGESQGEMKLLSHESNAKCDFMETSLPTNKSELDIIKEKVDNQLSKKELLVHEKNLNDKKDHSLTNLPTLNRRAKSSPKDGLRKFNEENIVIRGVIPYVNDVETWIKRNKLPANSKVFIVHKGYNCIRDSLLERNWVENPGFESNCFHFKYTLKSRDLN